MVGHPRVSDGPEEDRVELAQPLETVVGHHRALPQVPLARPVERLVAQLDSVRGAGRIYDGSRRRQDLAPDSVTGDCGDSVPGHLSLRS
jgi:hypothetical protein